MSDFLCKAPQRAACCPRPLRSPSRGSRDSETLGRHDNRFEYAFAFDMFVTGFLKQDEILLLATKSRLKK